MRRNFRNRKIASVPVKGPAFRDPKGTSRPSAEGKVSGEGEAGQPRGRGGAVCRWHTNKAPTGAAAETRDPRMRLLCRGKAAARVEA